MLFRGSVLSESAEKQPSPPDELSSERDIIEFSTKQLIMEINNKRKRDTSLVSGECNVAILVL